MRTLADWLLGRYIWSAIWLARKRESMSAGQGLVEYALIIAIVAIMLIAALVALRSSLANTFNTIASNLNNRS